MAGEKFALTPLQAQTLQPHLDALRQVRDHAATLDGILSLAITSMLAGANVDPSYWDGTIETSDQTGRAVAINLNDDALDVEVDVLDEYDIDRDCD